MQLLLHAGYFGLYNHICIQFELMEVSMSLICCVIVLVYVAFCIPNNR